MGRDSLPTLTNTPRRLKNRIVIVCWEPDDNLVLKEEVGFWTGTDWIRPLPLIQSLTLLASCPLALKSVLPTTSPVRGEDLRIWNHLKPSQYLS